MANHRLNYTGEQLDALLESIPGKQIRIDDLDQIRSGAASGATAVQPEQGKGLSANDYTNEDKSKLADLHNYDDTDVQQRLRAVESKDGFDIHSLNSEDNIDDTDEIALHDVSASDKRKTTWSNIKAKLKTYFDTLYVAVASLADYRTASQQDAIDAGKQDALVSGTNLKTINHESLLGSGDITIQDDSVMYINVTGQEEEVNGETQVVWSADKSFADIEDAYNAGKFVKCALSYEGEDPMFLDIEHIGSDYADFGFNYGGYYIRITDSEVYVEHDEGSFFTSVDAVNEMTHPAIETSIGSGMVSNKLYNLGTISLATTMTLAAPSDVTVANHWYFTFGTGATAPSITWDSAITAWQGNCLTDGLPDIKASKHYEVSVLGGVAVIMES